jgi:hypothetical protein
MRAAKIDTRPNRSRTMTPSRWNRWIPCVLSLLLGAPAWGQDALVVAGDGSGDFVQLTDAIAAAADGDVILVRPHTERYEAAEITGKSLTVIGIGVHRPGLEDLRVTQLSPGQVVTLRFLDLQGRAEIIFGGFITYMEPGLSLTFNQGSVWVEDAVFTGASGIAKWGGSEEGVSGLVVVGTEGVVVVDSESEGGVGAWSVGGTSYAGGDGARLLNSHVAFHGSRLEGGMGSIDVAHLPGQGGAGVDSSASNLFASGSTLTGGDTGESFGAEPLDAPSSGLVARSSSTVHHLATSFQAGQGGAPPGEPITVEPSSTVDDLDDVHRAFKVPAPVREDQEASALYAGEPGDLVLLRISLTPGWTMMPGLKGVLHLGPSTIDLFVGAAGPEGTLDLPFRGPALPVGTQALTAFAQPVVAAGGGPLRLVAPSSIVFIAESIQGP